MTFHGAWQLRRDGGSLLKERVKFHFEPHEAAGWCPEKAWKWKTRLSVSPRAERTPHMVFFNIFHQFLALFPSKGGDKFPSPWMWAELSDWLLTNRVRQQWECVISKIRWQRTLQLPLCAVSEGSQTPCCEQTQWTTGWKTEDSHPQLCESFWKWFLQP